MWRITNLDLDVYEDRPVQAQGRWGILIHIGNYIRDIVGCIAVGTTGNSKSVRNSGVAIDHLRDLLTEDQYTLIIEPRGTK